MSIENVLSDLTMAVKHLTISIAELTDQRRNAQAAQSCTPQLHVASPAPKRGKKSELGENTVEVAAPVAEVAAPVAETVQPPVAPTVTLAEVKQAANKVLEHDANARDQIIAVLNKYGAAKTNDLDPKYYHQVLDDLIILSETLVKQAI